ncbi:hypothetical protein [Sporosarcina sp. P1]|uniref:hypothetical protein n=1 Tax=Sporosarcina sp. P1 TaxID=2048257 RepID=UPI00117BD5A9|nr:hypothetical protein [Sporosarcina sp. P1]
MKATEENKSTTMVTLEAETVGLDELQNASFENDSNLYELIRIIEKPGFTKMKIQLIPLKEGEGKLNVWGSHERVNNLKKFTVHIKNINGELKLTLEEKADYLSSVGLLDITADEKIKNISLSKLDGKLVSDNVSFENCINSNYYTCIGIEERGKYIATVRFATGKDLRYAIEAIVQKEGRLYDIKTLRERPTYVFDIEELFNHDYSYDKEALKKIGKHTTLTPNANWYN